ncbi:transducin family protein / WD-40 repeat family protein isoform X2 [Wolffia australiana]
MAMASSSRGELDLDSLLRSHGAVSSDEEDDGEEEIEANAFRHRTVDEILDDSDASSSSGDTVSLQSAAIFLPPADEPIDRRSELSAEEEKNGGSSSVTFPELTNSKEISVSSLSRSLPPLFGGLWKNPKPGQALAVAAAASRAIKSRREKFSSLEKVAQSVIPTNNDDDIEEIGIFDSDNSLGLRAKPSSGETNLKSSLPSPSPSLPPTSDDSDLEIAPKEENTSTHCLLTENDDTAPEEESEETLDFKTEPEVETEAETETIREDVGNSSLSQEPSDDHKFEESVTILEREEDIELQLDAVQISGEKERAIRKAEKRLRSSMKPVEWAEELEKRQASSGLHWEEGAVAQPMRLKGTRRDPPAVGYLQTTSDNAVTRALSSQIFVRDHGSPTVLAVHLNSIAVGTSKGLVLVIPSKYSSQSEDNMEAKMSLLGSYGDRPYASVTSMCFNPQGDLLLVGCSDGRLTVWDVQKASYIKIIHGEHAAPVVHVLFLGQDLQATRQFKVVTGDSKGLVLLHTFSGVRLLNLFSVKTQCLLDGQKTGTVISASPLHFHESYFGSLSSQGSMGSMVGAGVGGDTVRKPFGEGTLPEEGVVIFATHQNALVVRLSPNVEVYEKLSRPDGTREGSLPYTAWKSYSYSREMSSDPVSWLSIAWDRKVEIFHLNKSKLTKYSSWNLESEAMGIQWLDDEMLVIVTFKGYLELYRKGGEELHRTSFASNASGIDDGIIYHTYFTNIFGNPEKAYQSSVAVRGATVYILTRTQLVVSRLLPWKERIQTLHRAGDWMGALDLAMRLYDGQSHGVIDLPKSVDAIREVMMPFLVDLILSYVDEVFSYISVASGYQPVKQSQEDDTALGIPSSTAEAEEQFSCVAGVAVEFCVHIMRLDILFDGIFFRFVSVKHAGTFLEILEPYILKDMLGCLPPEIMQALVEYYSSKGWLQRVEQCVLHMDISSLDFNQVIRLCREHGLYSALIYLFNRGLDDYRTPLEDLLIVITKDQRTETVLMYRMLVYLKYCFLGLAFPPGHGKLPPNRIASVRKELLKFLLEDSTALTSNVVLNFKSFYGTCPNLCHLLWLDTESTLEVIRYAFPGPSINLDSSASQCSELNSEEDINTSTLVGDNAFLLQNILNFLILILDVESVEKRSFKVDENGVVESWPLEKDLIHVIEFIVWSTASKQVTVGGNVLKYILEFLTADVTLSTWQTDTSERFELEKKVLSLLNNTAGTDWDNSVVLDQCLKAQFFQACGLIHARGGHYLSALDCYMRDKYENFITFVFIHDTMSKLKNSELSTFHSGVKRRIPELIKLSREDAFLLVLDYFGTESMDILSQLQGYPESLFLFLKSIFDIHLHGTLDFPVLRNSLVSEVTWRMGKPCSERELYMNRVSEFGRLPLQNPFNVDDKMTESFIELMCQYEPRTVLRFLETFDNYRLENCLQMCQKYGVNDAAAFLLERAGDVGAALEFLMNGMDTKIAILADAVEEFTTAKSVHIPEAYLLNECLQMDEVSSLHDVLDMAIGLCQRNTKRLDLPESKSLWFRLLDLYCEPLRALYDSRVSSQSDPSSGFSVSKEGSSLKLRLLRGIFSYFVKEIVEKMVGYVPILSVMSKILADNGAQEFGDFKLALSELLGTYAFERRILTTAKSLIEDDTFHTLGLLRKGVSHAYAPQSLTCCLCGYSLSKLASMSSIRLFSCGHVTHLHCEPQERGAGGRDFPGGCPLCVLKRKQIHTRDKSVKTEKTLIGDPTSWAIKRSSSVYHLHHDHDAPEKAYGTPVSRFAILSGLRESRNLVQGDPVLPLKLAPPSMYHEKVQKGGSPEYLKNEPSKSSQSRDGATKGFSKRFPLKSTIFGKEKFVNR